MGYCNRQESININELKNSIFNSYCNFSTPVQGPIYSEGYYISGDILYFYCSPYNINVPALQEKCQQLCPTYPPDEPDCVIVEDECNQAPNNCNCGCKCHCRKHRHHRHHHEQFINGANNC